MEVITHVLLSKLVGIPKLYWYGIEGEYNIMVLDFLGSNLEELLKESGGKFSMITTVMVADQMFRRIEFMHTHNYLHRDIKPENFTVGY